MFTRVIFLSTPALMVVLLAGVRAAPGGESRRQPAHPDSAALAGCPGVCIPACPNDYHFAGAAIQNEGDYDHVHYTCDLGGECTCGDTFNPPGGLPPAATLVMQEAREALARYPAVVTLNAERRAVQVDGCAGAVVAHLPVDAGTVSRLAMEFPGALR